MEVEYHEIALSVNILSIVTSFMCIIVYFYKKPIKSLDVSYNLLFNNISDLLIGLSTLSYPYSKVPCMMLGYCAQVFSFVLLEWNLLVISKLYYQLRDRKNKLIYVFFGKNNSNIRASVICILISSVIGVIPIPSNSYVKDDFLCSIRTKNGGKLIFILFYVPMWSSMAIVIYMLVYIEKLVNARLQNTINRYYYRYTYRPFPVLIFVCYLPFFVYRVLESANFSDSLLLFGEVAFCISRSHGFLNGVITFIIYKRELAVKVNMPKRVTELDSILID